MGWPRQESNEPSPLGDEKNLAHPRRIVSESARPEPDEKYRFPVQHSVSRGWKRSARGAREAALDCLESLNMKRGIRWKAGSTAQNGAPQGKIKGQIRPLIGWSKARLVGRTSQARWRRQTRGSGCGSTIKKHESTGQGQGRGR